MSNEDHRDEDLTAREWTVTDTASNYRFNVVRIGTHDVVFPDEDTARLAAAAPRLLAALRWAREVLVGEYNVVSPANPLPCAIRGVRQRVQFRSDAEGMTSLVSP